MQEKPSKKKYMSRSCVLASVGSKRSSTIPISTGNRPIGKCFGGYKTSRTNGGQEKFFILLIPGRRKKEELKANTPEERSVVPSGKKEKVEGLQTFLQQKKYIILSLPLQVESRKVGELANRKELSRLSCRLREGILLKAREKPIREMQL